MRQNRDTASDLPNLSESTHEASGAQDAEWVRQALAGDRGVFDKLVDKYEKPALAVAYRLLSNAHDAQEVAQDAMLRAFRGLGSLENPRIFGPWLMRIVSNLALNFRHGRARRSMVSLDEQADRSGGEGEGNVLGQLLASAQQRPDQELMTAELADRIRKALDELPDRQRMALILFSIEDRPQKEVAEIIGCSVEAVKWHVFTARKKLKEKLADLLAGP